MPCLSLLHRHVPISDHLGGKRNIRVLAPWWMSCSIPDKDLSRTHVRHLTKEAAHDPEEWYS